MHPRPAFPRFPRAGFWIGTVAVVVGCCAVLLGSCGEEERIDPSQPGGESPDGGPPAPPEADDAPVETDGGTYPAHCFDGHRNGGEPHRDCGGPCPPCAPGSRCVRAAECASGVCSRGFCLEPSCHDDVNNGDEVDVDCGGSCEPCESGASCGVSEDCASTVCHEGTCADTSCADGLQNRDETDVDCGGSCPGCGSGSACRNDADCASLTCEADSGTCTEPTCDDFVRNQGEGDVDCGGPCEPCPDLALCHVDADCQSALCQEGACSIPTCFDEVQNQDETDVDCGGSCEPCGDGAPCEEASDCTSGVCDGTCQEPSCDDGVENGGETDVDCGGSTECPRCDEFQVCVESSDCELGACTEGRCGETECNFIGTDSFGYFGCSRTVPTEALPCPDIRTTGTTLPLGNDNLSSVPIGFEFDFYGSTHTDVAVQSNGGLLFESSLLTHLNECMPERANLIAVFWDDLAPDRSGSTVRYETVGTAPDRKFVTHWDTQAFPGSSSRGVFTAVLHEGTNHIQVCYEAVTFGLSYRDHGVGATVGIQGSSTEYLEFSCNSASLEAGMILEYFHP